MYKIVIYELKINAFFIYLELRGRITQIFAQEYRIIAQSQLVLQELVAMFGKLCMKA